MKQTLYKKDNKGKIRLWEIVVLDESYTTPRAEIRIRSGLFDGEKVITARTITEGKNHGKSNATTPYTQALAEAKSEIESKRKEGYQSLEDLNLIIDEYGRVGFIREELDNQRGWTTLYEALMLKLPTDKTVGKEVRIPQPMLAQKYDATLTQSSSKNLKKLKLEGKVIAIQPKIDGLRCVIHIVDGNVEFYSRTGEKFHNLKTLKEQIKEIVENLHKENMWIDGELYTDMCSFNSLNGALRKQSVTPYEDTITLNIFDIVMDKPFKERLKFLETLQDSLADLNRINVVPTYIIEANEEKLQEQHDKFIARGHEGLMIRTLDGMYENRRSWSLLKMKVFEDDEFVIVGGEEAKRKGELGSFFVTTIDNYKPEVDTIRDAKTLEQVYGKYGAFGATPKFTIPERRQFWSALASLKGKEGTVEYFGISEYGVPRHPKMMVIHDNKKH